MKNFTRFLALMLAVLFAVGTISIFATDLADIDDSPYTSEIDAVTSLGIIESSYGIFQPTAKVARWKFVVYAVKALTGLTDDATWTGGTNTTTFTDVTGKLGLSAVSYAVSLDLIKGRSETIFDPTTTITLAEAATIMVRALGYDYDVRYNAEHPDSWKWAYLAKAMELGVVDGLAADALDPDHPVTKEEAALIIYNTLFITRKNGSTVADKVWGGIEIDDEELTQLVIMSAKAVNAKKATVSATLLDAYAVHTTGYVKLNGFVNGKVDDTYTLYMKSDEFKAYTGFSALDIVEKGYVGASIDVTFVGDSIDAMSVNAPTIKKGLAGTASFDGTVATFVDEAFETAGADLYVSKTSKYTNGYPVYREDGVYKMSKRIDTSSDEALEATTYYGIDGEEVYDFYGNKFFLDEDNNIVAEWVSDINSTAYKGVIVSGQYGKFASMAEIYPSDLAWDYFDAQDWADGNYRPATEADLAKVAIVYEENKDSQIANATSLDGVKATIGYGRYTATIFDDDGDGEADRIFVQGTDYTEVIGRLVGGAEPTIEILAQDDEGIPYWDTYLAAVANSDNKIDKLSPKVNASGTAYESFKALAAADEADYFVAMKPASDSASLEIIEWIPYQYGQIVNLAEVVNPSSNYTSTAIVGIKDRDTDVTTNFFVDVDPVKDERVTNPNSNAAAWKYYYNKIGVGVDADVAYLSVDDDATEGKILADRTVVVSQWVRFITRDVSAIKTVPDKGDNKGKVTERENKTMILYIDKMTGSALKDMIYISSDISTPSAATFTVLNPAKAEITTLENVNLVDTVFNDKTLAWLYTLRTNLSIKTEAGDFAYSTDGKAFAGYDISELWANDYKDVVEYFEVNTEDIESGIEYSIFEEAEEWSEGLYVFDEEKEAFVLSTDTEEDTEKTYFEKTTKTYTDGELAPVFVGYSPFTGTVDDLDEYDLYYTLTDEDNYAEWANSLLVEELGIYVPVEEAAFETTGSYRKVDQTYTAEYLALHPAEFAELDLYVEATADPLEDLVDVIHTIETKDMSHTSNLLYLTFTTDGVGKFYTVKAGKAVDWTDTKRTKTATEYTLLTDALVYIKNGKNADNEFYFEKGKSYPTDVLDVLFSAANNTKDNSDKPIMTYKTTFGGKYTTAKSYTFEDESKNFEIAYLINHDLDEYTVEQTQLLPYYEGEGDGRHIAGYYEFFAGTTYSVSSVSLVQRASDSKFIQFSTSILESLKDKKGNLPAALTKTDKSFTVYKLVEEDDVGYTVFKIDDSNYIYEFTPAVTSGSGADLVITSAGKLTQINDKKALTAEQKEAYEKVVTGVKATKTFISRGVLTFDGEVYTLGNTTDKISDSYLYKDNTVSAAIFEAATTTYGIPADSFTASAWSDNPDDLSGIIVKADAKTYKVSDTKTETRYTYTVTADATGNTGFIASSGIDYNGNAFTGLMLIDGVSVGAYNDSTKFVVIEPQNITVNSEASAYTQAQGYTFTSYTAAQIAKMRLSIHQYRADFLDSKGNGKTATYVVIFGNVIPGDTGTVTLTECKNATVDGLELGTTKSIPTGTTSYTVTYDSETYPILTVKVNGTAVEVDEDGKFTFTVAKDTAYSISVSASEEPVDTGFVRVTKNANTDTVTIGNTVAAETNDVPVGEYVVTVTPKEGYPIVTVRVNREFVTVTNNSFTLTVEKDETYDVEVNCSAYIRVFLNSPVNAVLTTNTDGKLVWTWTTAENKAIDIFSTETLSGSVYESYVWDQTSGYPTHIYDVSAPGVYTVVYDPDPNGTGTYRLIGDKGEPTAEDFEQNVFTTDTEIANLLSKSEKLSTGAFYGTEAANTILFFDLFCKSDDDAANISYANRTPLQVSNFKFVSFTTAKGYTVIDATKLDKCDTEHPTAYNFLPWNLGTSYAASKWAAGNTATTAELAAVTGTDTITVDTITFKYTLGSDGKIIVFVNTTTDAALKSGK